MKSIEMSSGGPIMPRSKSRAIDKSFISSGRSKCPIPGGEMVAIISLSWRWAER